MTTIDTALPDAEALKLASDAFSRPLQFSAGAMKELESTNSVGSLRKALWAYSVEESRMDVNWALVSYVMHGAPVAVMITDVATRAELNGDGYRHFCNHLSFRLTMEDGREDRIIVYVRRVRGRRTVN